MAEEVIGAIYIFEVRIEVVDSKAITAGIGIAPVFAALKV